MDAPPHSPGFLARDEDAERIAGRKGHPPSVPVVEVSLEHFELVGESQGKGRIAGFVGNEDAAV
jgi:hypothetical protein